MTLQRDCDGKKYEIHLLEAEHNGESQQPHRCSDETRLHLKRSPVVVGPYRSQHDSDYFFSYSSVSKSKNLVDTTGDAHIINEHAFENTIFNKNKKIISKNTKITIKKNSKLKAKNINIKNKSTVKNKIKITYA